MAKILGDLGVGSVFIHLDGRPDPTLAIPTVGATSAEAMTEGLHVGELVHEFQQRPEDRGRLRFSTRGVDADVGRPDGADSIEETRGVAPEDPAGAEGLDENNGRRESPLAIEDGPWRTPSRVEVVRGVGVYPRNFDHPTVRDLDPGPPRGSPQVKARAVRLGAARVLRLVPSHEVSGEAAPVVAGRRQLNRRGVFRVRHVDEGRAREDVVEGGHQRQVHRGVVHEADLRTAVPHLAATPHHGDRRARSSRDGRRACGMEAICLANGLTGRIESMPRNVA